MSCEEFRNAVNYTRCIDPAQLLTSSPFCHALKYIRLALEVLHYIQEPVVDIGLVVKLDFHLIEVGKGILQGIWVSHNSDIREMNQIEFGTVA